MAGEILAPRSLITALVADQYPVISQQQWVPVTVKTMLETIVHGAKETMTEDLKLTAHTQNALDAPQRKRLLEPFLGMNVNHRGVSTGT